MRRATAWVSAWVVCAGVAACDGVTEPRESMEACGPLPLFTVLPVPAEEIDWADVVGRVGAPAQTLPKAHTGVILKRAGVPLVAPGDVTVERVGRVRYLASPFRQGLTDYDLTFRACAEVSGHFAHVPTLGSWLPADIQWQNCQTYSTPEETVESCSVWNLRIRLAAGEAMGFAGTSPEMGLSLDMGLQDTRVNHQYVSPWRYPEQQLHAVCPFEYYDAASREVFLSRLRDGSSPGRSPAGEPRCGTLQVDVAGTAQGVWAEPGMTGTVGPSDGHRFVVLVNNPYQPEAELTLALGPDPLGGANAVVPKATAGRVNRAFDQVAADGTIHCYGPASIHHGPAASWLLAVGTGGALTIERFGHGDATGPCEGDPTTWAFGAGAVTLVR
jgi:hypothetical protein